ncbi:MAG: hypothetical protein FWG21_05430, partial [Oscillospiraceae bacterium]|nr:hypothetical protein [Oscillospiraceae bacterium]
MKETQQTRITRRNLLVICITVVCCALLFSLIGITFLDSDVTSRFTREIINDSYDTYTIPLSENSVIHQTICISGKVYGFRLPLSFVSISADGVSTESSIPNGEISVSLYDSNDRMISHSNVDMADIIDGFFHNFILDEAVVADGTEMYTLHIQAFPEGDNTVVLSKSSKSVGDTDEYELSSFVLLENTQSQEGILALQYIVEYCGNIIYTPYILMSALLTVFIIVLYLLIFVYKAAIHKVFFFACLVLGTIFIFIIPFRTAPDEYVHIANAYSYSNRVFGIKDKNGTLYLREGDDMFLATYDYDATTVFAYREITEQLFSKAPPGP